MQNREKPITTLTTTSGIAAAGSTDVRQVRTTNQDSLLITSLPNNPANVEILLAVADGMGGHAGGGVASALAIKTLERYFENLPASITDTHSLKDLFTAAVTAANNAIQSEAKNQQLKGMGTTLTAALIGTSSALVANVGDSRTYHLRKGTLTQVTQDHSVVAEQVRQGLLPEDALSTHPRRNVLSRALGTNPEIAVDLFPLELESNDLLLLCSDGLYPMVTHQDLVNVLTQYDVAEACRVLISMANSNGGPDNITAVIAKIP